MEETKRKRMGYINRSLYDPTKLTGTLYWEDGQTFKLANFDVDGDERIADVRRKTGEKYVAKNGVEYDSYEDIGAIRFNVKTGTGELVVDFDGVMPVKYPFQTFLDVDKNGNEVRKLRFPEKKVNPFRNMFDQAAEVVEEKAEDEVPF